MTAFLFLGGGGLVAGLVVGFAFGTSLARVVRLIALGLVLASVFLLFVFASAPKTSRDACHDCYELGGRWGDWFLLFVFVGFNVVAWIVGVLIGKFLRGRRVTT